MKPHWTRREFIRTGLVAPLAARGNPAASPYPFAKPATQDGRLSRELSRVLTVAMDEIIPHSDGMPAASEVGCRSYLNRLFREREGLKSQFRIGLTRTLELSVERFGSPFAELQKPDRIEVLKSLEKANSGPGGFVPILRDTVYEAYYTRPQVWRLLDYESYATHKRGPSMEPFDPEILVKVRDLPTLYRKVES